MRRCGRVFWVSSVSIVKGSPPRLGMPTRGIKWGRAHIRGAAAWGTVHVRLPAPPSNPFGVGLSLQADRRLACRGIQEPEDVHELAGLLRVRGGVCDIQGERPVAGDWLVLV